jgi:hypothetical protein
MPPLGPLQRDLAKADRHLRRPKPANPDGLEKGLDVPIHSTLLPLPLPLPLPAPPRRARLSPT